MNGGVDLYCYRAVVLRVVDGDTADVEVDLGFDVRLRMRLRLLGLDAPELNSGDPAERVLGVAARDYLSGLVGGKAVIVRTEKDRREKYGRYLATLLLPGGDGPPADVNRMLVEAGHARWRDYRWSD